MVLRLIFSLAPVTSLPMLGFAYGAPNGLAESSPATRFAVAGLMVCAVCLLSAVVAVIAAHRKPVMESSQA
ncbi:hypothetical protein K2X85_06210 [bacterium]|jgi:hypothetical protein|nr:hypothetical protein [bacterium]